MNLICIKEKKNESCVHPNGGRLDKEKIRIKFIPVIEAGLYQQEPRGQTLAVGPPSL